METAINLVFFFFTFVIISRIFLSYMGSNYNHGTFYDFVYKYSEILLKPIRTKLPYSSVDFSPVVAIIGLSFLKSILDEGLIYIYDGNFIGFFKVVLIFALDMSSSLISFYLIILLIKYSVDRMRLGHNRFVYIIDYLTNPLINKINPKIPLKYRRYSVLIIVAGLFLFTRVLFMIKDQLYPI